MKQVVFFLHTKQESSYPSREGDEPCILARVGLLNAVKVFEGEIRILAEGRLVGIFHVEVVFLALGVE